MNTNIKVFFINFSLFCVRLYLFSHAFVRWPRIFLFFHPIVMIVSLKIVYDNSQRTTHNDCANTKKMYKQLVKQKKNKQSIWQQKKLWRTSDNIRKNSVTLDNIYTYTSIPLYNLCVLRPADYASNCDANTHTNLCIS